MHGYIAICDRIVIIATNLYYAFAILLGETLGRTILGLKKNIKSLSRDDLANYTKTSYTADRMVLVGEIFGINLITKNKDY